MGLRAVFVALVILSTGASPCLADAIVTVVNKSNFGVTINVDGAFGCRAESRATAPKDVDAPNTCTFGATLGAHTLELHFDNGNTVPKSVDVPAKGYVLTLTGAE